MGQLTGTLRVERLSKSFGAKEILTLDLTLPLGEFCLIIGENGVGKSTFFRCLLDLELHAGTVKVEGFPAKSAIVGVLDESVLYPQWRVSANIDYLLNKSKSAQIPIIQELLGSQLLNMRARELSTGQRKMVLLATALATAAPIVLLDEFANGLDRNARSRIREVLGREMATGQRTFLATGHDLSVLAELPTRIVLLSDGQFRDITNQYRAAQELNEIYTTDFS